MLDLRYKRVIMRPCSRSGRIARIPGFFRVKPRSFAFIQPIHCEFIPPLSIFKVISKSEGDFMKTYGLIFDKML